MRNQGEFMVLNTHLIDLRGAPNKRACAEGKCPVKPGTELKNQTYYLRYTIKWRNWDRQTLPLEVITFDATDNNTKWGDLPWFPGGYAEKHDSLKNDPLSVATINDGRSGDFDGKRSCHI